MVKFAAVITDQVDRELEASEPAEVALSISQRTDVSAQRGACVVSETVSTMRRISVEIQSAS